jgi:hypothetical protein
MFRLIYKLPLLPLTPKIKLNKTNTQSHFIGLFGIFLYLLPSCIIELEAQNNAPKSTVNPDSTLVEKSGKKPRYNFSDQFSSYYGAPTYSSPFYLNNLSNAKYNFSFNPEGSIRFDQSTKKEGSPFTNFRIPETVPLDQYSRQQDKQLYSRMLRQYASATDGVSDISGRGLKPKLFKSKVFDSILGQKIDLQPNGFVSVEIGAFFQNSDNLCLISRPVSTLRVVLAI